MRHPFRALEGTVTECMSIAIGPTARQGMGGRIGRMLTGRGIRRIGKGRTWQGERSAQDAGVVDGCVTSTTTLKARTISRRGRLLPHPKPDFITSVECCGGRCSRLQRNWCCRYFLTSGASDQVECSGGRCSHAAAVPMVSFLPHSNDKKCAAVSDE